MFRLIILTKEDMEKLNNGERVEVDIKFTGKTAIVVEEGEEDEQ